MPAPRCCCFCRLSAVAPARVGLMHHSCGTSVLGNTHVFVPRLLPDMAMALARLRPPADGLHASTHARYTRLTRHTRFTGHRARHTGKALVLTRATPAFLRSHASHQPSTSFERDQREGHQREANAREDGQEHHGRVRAARTEGAITTQHMANSHQFMLASRAQMAFATNGDIYGRSEKSTRAANAVS